MRQAETASKPSMKSCFGLLLVLLVFTLVAGGGGLVWYLSHSAEFSRKDAPVPRAVPARVIR
jgi:flagellar basal body-associated protein FliL